MALVTLTRHLRKFFPTLPDSGLELSAENVREAVAALDRAHPGLGFYLCDETGALRKHVTIYVNDEQIRDNRTLSDALTSSSRVFVSQALSGG